MPLLFTDTNKNRDFDINALPEYQFQRIKQIQKIASELQGLSDRL